LKRFQSWSPSAALSLAIERIFASLSAQHTSFVSREAVLT